MAVWRSGTHVDPSFAVLRWLLLATLLPCPAAAQTIARSFGELEPVLAEGQLVIVTDGSGQKLKGRVESVSPSLLALKDASPGSAHRTWTFTEGAVREIRRTDSVLNGALVGLGAGVGAFWVGLRARCGSPLDEECALNGGWAILLGTVPVGAVVGAVVDSLVGRDLVYRVPSGSTRRRLHVSPRVATGGGMEVVLRF